jgi:hypothetical protein
MMQHRGGTRDRRADQPGIDCRATRLVPRAKEGVGGTADAQPVRGPRLHHLFRFGEPGRQRLFQINVLAGIQHAQADRRVCLRDRQVDDDFDLRIGKQCLDWHGAQTIRLGLRLRRFGLDIGYGLHADQRTARRPA